MTPGGAGVSWTVEMQEQSAAVIDYGERFLEFATGKEICRRLPVTRREIVVARPVGARLKTYLVNTRLVRADLRLQLAEGGFVGVGVDGAEFEDDADAMEAEFALVGAGEGFAGDVDLALADAVGDAAEEEAAAGGEDGADAEQDGDGKAAGAAGVGEEGAEGGDDGEHEEGDEGADPAEHGDAIHPGGAGELAHGHAAPQIGFAIEAAGQRGERRASFDGWERGLR